MADTKNEKDIISDQVEVESSGSEKEGNLEELPSRDINQHYAKEFTVNHGSFPWRDMVILENDTPVLYAEISEVTRKKPDITLHKGGSDDGPVVGVSRHRFSRSLTCGLGHDDISMNWAKWETLGVFKGKYKLDWNGKQYTLRHAKTADYGGRGAERLMFSHFKVVDEASEQIIALYVSETGIGRKKGTLKIVAGVHSELELLIILGITSVRDKQARRAKYAAMASSGGGGGGGGGG